MSILMDNAGVTVAVLLGLVVLVGIFSVAKRYKIARPNEAYIVTGRKGKSVRNPETGEISQDLSGQKVVMGGGVFVLPFVQTVHSMSLESRRIAIRINGAVSKDNILLNLEGVAIVKVGGTETAVRAAAQRFLGQQEEIEASVQEVLAGSLRAIVGTLTVEQVIRDRAALATQVAEEAENSLTNQGLILDTLQVQEVTDNTDFIKNLGRPEAAEIMKRAEIADAEAQRESAEAQVAAREKVAVANRTLTLREAEIQADTDAAKARASAAGPIEEAARQQEVISAQEQVAVRQAALTERELEISVKKPADARLYEAQRAADASKVQAIADAQAEAERVRLAGEADAEAARLRGQAEADIIRARGEAEADAALRLALAEAEGMEKKAEAFANYGEAALMEMVVEVLPKIVREAAAPMGNIDNLTVVSSDGASKVVETGTNVITQAMAVFDSFGGQNGLKDLIGRFSATGNQAASTPVSPAASDNSN